jgi:rod shape-determining protein MreB and related proteins
LFTKEVGMTVPMNPACSPTAVAVDLGSCTVGLWAARRGTVSGSCGDAFTSAGTLVRRGRVVDVEGCTVLLSQLVRRYPEPVPAGAVVVACRPVLANEVDQAAVRRIVDAVFRPARLLFIDTVRAAAVGSGAAAGTLLIIDVGAELTEIAVLKDGRVVTARRAEIGTRDLSHGATVDLLGGIVAGHVQELRRGPAASDLAVARTRGLLLVGDGASHPDLAVSLSRALRLQVHRAAAPRTAAINGAGLAAMAALRHPAAV